MESKKCFNIKSYIIPLILAFMMSFAFTVNVKAAIPTLAELKPIPTIAGHDYFFIQQSPSGLTQLFLTQEPMLLDYYYGVYKTKTVGVIYQWSQTELGWIYLSATSSSVYAYPLEVMESNHEIFEWETSESLVSSGVSGYVPPTTDGDDSNYKLYESGVMEGMVITNPYDGITVNEELVSITAHATIFVGSLIFNDIMSAFRQYDRFAIAQFCEDNTELYVNATRRFVDIDVEMDSFDIENGSYDLSICTTFKLDEGHNSVSLHGEFLNGGFVNLGQPLIFTDLSIRYYNTIGIIYNQFAPIVTTVEDGNTTIISTTTTGDYIETQTITVNEDTSITTITTNPSGTVDTEHIAPNGQITFTPGDLVVLEPKDYTGALGVMLKAIESVNNTLVATFNALIGIPEILVVALTNVIASFGDLLPLMKEVFSFLPQEVNYIIVTCFGFLGVGVALRTFGRK